MAGKIDGDGTVWRGDSLELVGSTEIWMGSFHVADIRPEVGRGTRLSQLEALLENAREGVSDDEDHAEELRGLEERLNDEIESLEKENSSLVRQLEEADARTERAESIIKELDKKGPKATILSLMDQVATLTQEAVHSAALLSKADAEIAQLKAKKK